MTDERYKLKSYPHKEDGSKLMIRVGILRKKSSGSIKFSLRSAVKLSGVITNLMHKSGWKNQYRGDIVYELADTTFCVHCSTLLILQERKTVVVKQLVHSGKILQEYTTALTSRLSSVVIVGDGRAPDETSSRDKRTTGSRPDQRDE